MKNAIFPAVSLLWTCTLLAWISDSGIDFVECVAATAGTALLTAAWLIARARRHSAPEQASFLTRSNAVLLCAPLASTLVAVAIFLTAQSPLNPLLRARVALSVAALQRAADDTAAIDDRWIGLFHVRRVERDAGRVRFVTAACGVIDQCGIAYAPGGSPAGLHKLRFRALRDGWYLFYDVF